MPKTLIFAKSDSHAEDIVKIVREEFGEANDFCKKVTYKIKETPKDLINRFGGSYYPRIAVTVDMIATGTDIKPLEVVLFMRDVKSAGYFEQMKGRGSRTVSVDDFRSKVSSVPNAQKTHFVVVDAVGVLKSKKTQSRPLERKKSVATKDLLEAIGWGNTEEDLFLSLASRLIRLDKMLTDTERQHMDELSEGKGLKHITRDLLNAYDPDVIESEMLKLKEKDQLPSLDIAKEKAQQQLIRIAATSLSNPELRQYIEKVRQVHEQVLDNINIDKVTHSEWNANISDKANKIVQDFTAYIAAHKNEIKALSIFYDQPYKRKELTFKMIKEVLEKLKQDKPLLAPHYVWEAYAQVEDVKGNNPKNELVALVSLIRRVTGIDQQLTPYNKTVDKNFQDWVFQKHSGAGEKFTEAQMAWLRMLKDQIATSFHVEIEDLDYTPFDAQGGRGRMWQLFGEEMNEIIEEMNESLVA